MKACQYDEYSSLPCSLFDFDCEFCPYYYDVNDEAEDGDCDEDCEHCDYATCPKEENKNDTV